LHPDRFGIGEDQYQSAVFLKAAGDQLDQQEQPIEGQVLDKVGAVDPVEPLTIGTQEVKHV